MNIGLLGRISGYIGIWTAAGYQHFLYDILSYAGLPRPLNILCYTLYLRILYVHFTNYCNKSRKMQERKIILSSLDELLRGEGSETPVHMELQRFLLVL